MPRKRKGKGMNIDNYRVFIRVAKIGNLTDGSWLLSISYVSSSFVRQHISLPHTPDIFVGFRDRFCSFAILIDTAENSVKYVLQQSGRPQIPIPPRIFVSSRTPI